MLKNKLKNQAQATVWFARTLKSYDYAILKEHPCNKTRDSIFEVITPNSKKETYYVKFKRKFFNSFSKVFPKFYMEHPELGAVGESINVDCLKQALLCDKLIFIYPDERIYFIYPALLHEFATIHGLIRIQNKTHYIKEFGHKKEKFEVTACIPIKLLQPFFSKQLILSEVISWTSSMIEKQSNS